MAITLKRAVNFRSLSKLQSVVLAVQDKTQTLEISIARSCTNLIQKKAWRDTKKRKKTLDHIENSCKLWEAKSPNSELRMLLNLGTVQSGGGGGGGGGGSKSNGEGQS